MNQDTITIIKGQSCGPSTLTIENHKYLIGGRIVSSAKALPQTPTCKMTDRIMRHGLNKQKPFTMFGV